MFKVEKQEMFYERMSVLRLFLGDDVRTDGAQAFAGARLCGP